MKQIILLTVIISSTLILNAQPREIAIPENSSSALDSKQLNRLGIKAILEANDNKAAIGYFERAVAQDPACTTCRINLGRAKLRIQDFDGAILLFQELVKEKPESGETFSSFGEALAKVGRHKEAITAFESAVRLGVTDYYTLTNFSISLYETADPRKALKYLDISIEANPSVAETHNIRGLCLYRLGRKKKALEALKTADRLKPGNTEINNNLGVVYDALGKNDEARAHYQASIDSDATYAIAQYNLASNYLERGDRSRAYRKLTLLKMMDYGLADELQQLLWGRFVIDASRRKIR